MAEPPRRGPRPRRAGKPGGPGTRRGPGTAGTPPRLPGLKLKCSGYAHGPWSSTGLTATPGSPPTALCDAGQDRKGRNRELC